MSIVSIIGIGLIAAVLAMLLRQYRPEFAFLISLGAGIIIVLICCTGIVPVVEQINAMLDMSSMPVEYAGILFRALGICLLTQIASDACKDSGETAIASKVELAGRIMVLVLSLPLFQQVLSIVYSIVG